MSEEKCLEVRMLGEFTMSYGGETIEVSKSQTSRAMHLLQILLYAGDKGISRQKLMKDLFEREPVGDLASNLRVTTHTLRKLLKNTKLPDEPYIQNSNRQYRFVSSFPVRVDALIFRELLEKAKKREGDNWIEYLKKACRLYQGYFLPSLFGEEWVIVAEADYQRLYFECLEELCQLLKEREEYEEMLPLCVRASEMYPFDEWQVWQMDCLVSLGRSKEAIALYEKTAAMYFDELAMAPPKRMLEYFQKMSSHISLKTGEFREIQEMLKEKDERRGAYYCSYPSFVDTYRMLVRIMERTGESVYLLMCTIMDEQKHVIEDETRLREVSTKLSEAIRIALRQGDVYTRYNMSQFLVILLGIRREECPITIGRIDACFRKMENSRKIEVTYRTASIAEVDGPVRVEG